MVGGEPIHQDRPIGVRQRGILGRDEQFHRYGTLINEFLKAPPIGPQQAGNSNHVGLSSSSAATVPAGSARVTRTVSSTLSAKSPRSRDSDRPGGSSITRRSQYSGASRARVRPTIEPSE